MKAVPSRLLNMIHKLHTYIYIYNHLSTDSWSLSDVLQWQLQSKITVLFWTQTETYITRITRSIIMNKCQHPTNKRVLRKLPRIAQYTQGEQRMYLLHFLIWIASFNNGIRYLAMLYTIWDMGYIYYIGYYITYVRLHDVNHTAKRSAPNWHSASGTEWWLCRTQSYCYIH